MARLHKSFEKYVPGVSGMFMLLGMLLVGAIAGSILVSIITIICGASATSDLSTAISYPVMFIPPMLYALGCSRRAYPFQSSVAVDTNIFKPVGAAPAAILVSVATIAAAFMMDLVNAQMPAMPAWLEEALKNMTQGNVWVNFLCVSIMAPFFEEWLCRGMVLRGLLNCERKIKPVWAIIISAAFFAIIHMNPWQAVPAFALGCLFGYVYWKTGSLKLTMLMHFVNNTVALMAGQIDALKDMDYWTDVMGPVTYGICFAAFAAYLVVFFLIFKKIELQNPQGNCEVTPASEAETA